MLGMGRSNVLRRIVRSALHGLRYWLQSVKPGSTTPARYVTSAPSAQNAVDIFKGEWWSALPEPFAALEAGHLGIFNDARLTWALGELGDLNGATVLELGPLEGAHSYMLERAGAASVVAIEANPRAYLKCLVVKETLGLTHTHFLLGDFVEYLRKDPPRFSAVCASGVLYHMREPLELLALLGKVTDRLFLWTHYYDAELVSRNKTLMRRFTAEFDRDHEGLLYRLFRYQYWGSFGTDRFCGGSRPHAHWMRRADILAALERFGFNTVRINFETPEHPDGPAFALVALRT